MSSIERMLIVAVNVLIKEVLLIALIGAGNELLAIRPRDN